MKPGTLNILYWIFTILFAALMIFSAAGGIQPSADSVKILHDAMGYPIYFIQFISIAKLLGSIAILIPGLVRVKEWAYAGLFFDLAGAISRIKSLSASVSNGLRSIFKFAGAAFAASL